MATNLGKRKRTAIEKLEANRTVRGEESGSERLDAQEIFRRHFEAKFMPLPEIKKVEKVVQEVSDDEAEDKEDWGGISEGEGAGAQVVEHMDVESRMAVMSKEQLKAFMTSKPPSRTPRASIIRDKSGATIEDHDASESANLKKDLALQRLLAESHLLESSANPTLSGNNRHKSTDMRIQALGSKTSILKQEKMPMSHRKGITAKQNEREDKRRREARENGIILEKVKLGTKKKSDKNASDGKRDRGVGAPSVGKFSNGTLKLSKKDIFNVEGPKRGPSGRGGRGGGRGRGKRG